jgi:hypothetical protein
MVLVSHLGRQERGGLLFTTESRSEVETILVKGDGRPIKI